MLRKVCAPFKVDGSAAAVGHGGPGQGEFYDPSRLARRRCNHFARSS
jgi:hypothetical protein